MIQLENIIYTAKTHTTGGRDQGTSRSSDGRLEVRLSRPGASGGGTNPEQLFAAGWSACFISAMKIAAGKMKVALPDDLAIDAEVDVGPTPSWFGPTAIATIASSPTRGRSPRAVTRTFSPSPATSPTR